MATRQHEFVHALAQAYRALAELMRQQVLSEDSRRSVLQTLVTLEREISAWSEPFEVLDSDEEIYSNANGNGSLEVDFEDEPTEPQSPLGA